MIRQSFYTKLHRVFAIVLVCDRISGELCFFSSFTSFVDELTVYILFRGVRDQQGAPNWRSWLAVQGSKPATFTPKQHHLVRLTSAYSWIGINMIAVHLSAAWSSSRWYTALSPVLLESGHIVAKFFSLKWLSNFTILNSLETPSWNSVQLVAIKMLPHHFIPATYSPRAVALSEQMHFPFPIYILSPDSVQFYSFSLDGGENSNFSKVLGLLYPPRSYISAVCRCLEWFACEPCPLHLFHIVNVVCISGEISNQNVDSRKTCYRSTWKRYSIGRVFS